MTWNGDVITERLVVWAMQLLAMADCNNANGVRCRKRMEGAHMKKCGDVLEKAVQSIVDASQPKLQLPQLDMSYLGQFVQLESDVRESSHLRSIPAHGQTAASSLLG